MMKTKLVYLSLIIISASIICFEIIATRISSVIFESNYAFIILSIAILGIGCGGIYSYYKVKSTENLEITKAIIKSLALVILSFFSFIVIVTETNLGTNPLIYLFLLILPFFFAGIAYSQIFKTYSGQSFKLYAADLTGAAVGSILTIIVLDYFGAGNSILLLALLISIPLMLFLKNLINSVKVLIFGCVSAVIILFLIYNGNKDLLGKIPIGKFPEKDFHYVYPDPNVKSDIIESSWSIYGRADLVEYNHQDVVKQLFIDGAAGSPMYRFNGNKAKPGILLLETLLQQTTSIPFLFLNKNEKNNMLVIGPGGGREVLLGLFQDVEQITGVEINPDFVKLVKDYRNFNGGIYTDFKNINIQVAEGRHYIKETKNKYDLIVMALPSTEQLQNIDALAMNENYLLTVEAIRDYIKILTEEGQLIFTVHNDWELIRLIITSISAFEEKGVDGKDFLKHIAIVGDSFAPTIVIKKNPFSNEDLAHWKKTMLAIPGRYPSVSYLPAVNINNQNFVNRFLKGIEENRISLGEYIEKDKYNLTPCKDDSPYFYKISKGVSKEYLYLASGIALLNLLIITLPVISNNKKIDKERRSKHKGKSINLLLGTFICLGLGFMMLEISLFQKLILYLGSPTISLSILLCALLIGMGTGSYLGNRIFIENLQRRLLIISILIVISGAVLIILYPLILEFMLRFSIYVRVITAFVLILPFGFLLGIPFPTSLKLLKSEGNESLIPWMYGVNGAMSVLGSVLAVILSMLFGFTFSFFIGLFCYSIIIILAKNYSKNTIILKEKVV